MITDFFQFDDFFLEFILFFYSFIQLLFILLDISTFLILIYYEPNHQILPDFRK